jgi:uncharacterized membrane protein YdjX (TVP38/TMEM64 family)
LRVKEILKKENKGVLLKRLSKRSFVLAFLLSVIAVVLSFPSVQEKFDYLRIWFVDLENFIAGFNELIAFVIIMFLFFIDGCFFPIVPFNILFISCGMVFSAPVAILVNILGFALASGVKFFLGRRFGGGKAVSLVGRYSIVVKFMDIDGEHNKLLLVLLRFFSFIPVGLVSRAYGTTNIKTLPYIGLSVVGFLPRLILWSIVGVTALDPFSPLFYIPFVILLIVTGSAFRIYNSLSE